MLRISTYPGRRRHHITALYTLALFALNQSHHVSPSSRARKPKKSSKLPRAFHWEYAPPLALLLSNVVIRRKQKGLITCFTACYTYQVPELLLGQQSVNLPPFKSRRTFAQTGCTLARMPATLPHDYDSAIAPCTASSRQRSNKPAGRVWTCSGSTAGGSHSLRLSRPNHTCFLAIGDSCPMKETALRICA